MLTIQKFRKNEIGKDYVVGDLHGCYEELMYLLGHIGFNYDTDRLFSVGDLIDRGKDSVKCMRLVEQPWFFAVRGNHEELMLQAFNGFPDGRKIWEINGGLWWLKVSSAELEELYNLALKLPHIIEIEDVCNILHAETNQTNETILDTHPYSIQWGRSIISNASRIIQPSIRPGLKNTYVGHTPIGTCAQILSLIYIDRGYVFRGISTALAITEIGSNFVWELDQNMKVTKHEIIDYEKN